MSINTTLIELLQAGDHGRLRTATSLHKETGTHSNKVSTAETTNVLHILRLCTLVEAYCNTFSVVREQLRGKMYMTGT